MAAPVMDTSVFSVFFSGEKYRPQTTKDTGLGQHVLKGWIIWVAKSKFIMWRNHGLKKTTSDGCVNDKNELSNPLCMLIF